MRRLAAVMTLLVLALGVPADAAENGKAGVFDYYTLVLSWSPTFCEGKSGGEDGPQCNGKRDYAFVLHGLWPQYEKGFPEACRIGKKPWVPGPLIDSMLDIMPSPKLVIHEYKKHGTCSGLDPNGYFALARKLYGKITIPPAFQAPAKAITTSAAEVEAAFLAANPKMSAGDAVGRLRASRPDPRSPRLLHARGRSQELRPQRGAGAALPGGEGDDASGARQGHRVVGRTHRYLRWPARSIACVDQFSRSIAGEADEFVGKVWIGPKCVLSSLPDAAWLRSSLS